MIIVTHFVIITTPLRQTLFNPSYSYHHSPQLYRYYLPDAVNYNDVIMFVLPLPEVLTSTMIQNKYLINSKIVK